ncbi:MAG: vapC protein [Sphingomonas bacterium]|nr:vapC protein [Sphingomonas bacterium]
MGYLIDTNVAIYLRDGHPMIVRRIAELGDVAAVSLVTLVELEGGVYANPAFAVRRRARMDAMFSETPVLPLDNAAVTVYGEIVRTAGYSRTRLFDRLIAATALLHGLTLITINGADFRDIPGLSLEIWPDPAAQ